MLQQVILTSISFPGVGIFVLFDLYVCLVGVSLPRKRSYKSVCEEDYVGIDN